MTEENRLTMFRMLLFAAVIYNFSFWMSSSKINLTFKNMHGLFREAFSHVATKYLSYTRIFLFKSMLNEARIISTLQIVQLLYPVGPIPVWCYSTPVPCLDYCGIWGESGYLGLSSVDAGSKGTPSKDSGLGLRVNWTHGSQDRTSSGLLLCVNFAVPL